MIPQKLKQFIIVALILMAAFAIYVQVDNINTKNMTYRQKFLKTVYPMWMWFAKTAGIKAESTGNHSAKPLVSFYSLTVMLNDGTVLNFETLKGKKVLLVNTASDCGYTNQYQDLQKLAQRYKGKLEVIGFPANDFKGQEKGNDTAIAAFCRNNFGISFPLAAKSSVIKSGVQDPVFKWLSDSSQNGWNNKAPSWNFSKYVVNEKGELINYFDPSISPLSNEVIKAIEQNNP